MRRLAAGAGAALLVGLSFGAAPSARAAAGVSITKPANNATWDGTSSTDFHVTGQATPDGTGYITRVSVKADSADGADHHYPRPSDTAEQRYTDTTQGHGQAYDISIFPDINGKYTLTSTAEEQVCSIFGCSPGTSGTAKVTVTLAVPPKAPTGVSAALKDSVVTVSWAPNKEADMLGYLVERSKDNGSYSCVSSVDQSADATSYKATDDLKDEPGGVYRYRVIAVRGLDKNSAAPTCKDAGTGLKSPATGAPGTVAWKTTTPTTTGGGGGTGGGPTTTTPGGPKKEGGSGGLSKFASGAGGSSGSAGASRKPNLAPLAGLSSINDLAKTPHGSLAGGAGEPDTGFNELLPFGGGTSDQPVIGGDATKLPTDSGGGGHTTTLLFVAAGLLVTVLSMHVLWLKAQVDRVPLEALPPGDLPLA